MEHYVAISHHPSPPCLPSHMDHLQFSSWPYHGRKCSDHGVVSTLAGAMMQRTRLQRTAVNKSNNKRLILSRAQHTLYSWATGLHDLLQTFPIFLPEANADNLSRTGFSIALCGDYSER